MGTLYTGNFTTDKVLAAWQAFFSAVAVITGGSILGDVFPQRVGGLILISLGALHAAVTTYYVSTGRASYLQSIEPPTTLAISTPPTGLVAKIERNTVIA